MSEHGRRILKKGRLYIVTSGEYDDYGVVTAFTCLKDFDIFEAMEDYFKVSPPKYSERYDIYHKFVNFMAQTGLIEESRHGYVHLGYYGGLEFESLNNHPRHSYQDVEGKDV